MSTETYTLKFIIVGDSGVGKSCLLLQYTDRRFETMHDLTIGVEFGSKLVKADNKDVKIQIWDTAGQESFRSITRSYYRGSTVALLVFDLTRKESFKNITSWMNDVKTYSNAPVMVLIGSKSDLDNLRQVSSLEASAFADKYGMEYIETSAKTGSNVDGVFSEAIKKVMQLIKDKKIDESNIINKQKFGVINYGNINKNTDTNESITWCCA
jgi:Ras-related protein Rab-2A